MPANKRLRAPLIAMFGVIMAAVTFAGPAIAADSVYPPAAGVQVLGASASSNVKVAAAGTSAPTNSGLAFTGANAIGIVALGGLLLVGGGAMVLAGKRRKAND